MLELANSLLLGDFAKALTISPASVAEKSRYACRPIAVCTAERNTCLGRFVGQIGLADVPEFEEALHDLATANPSKVILDLAEVSLTKSAVGALLSFAAAMHGHNKRLYLYRPSEQIQAVLKELDLTPFFNVLREENDVIATLVV